MAKSLQQLIKERDALDHQIKELQTNTITVDTDPTNEFCEFATEAARFEHRYGDSYAVAVREYNTRSLHGVWKTKTIAISPSKEETLKQLTYIIADLTKLKEKIEQRLKEGKS